VDLKTFFGMTTGTQSQMLHIFAYPPSSGFFSALKAVPYNQCMFFYVVNPAIRLAIALAKMLYNVGNGFVIDSCLDAVYNVLKTYGVNFSWLKWPSLSVCLSGDVVYFQLLPNNQWTLPTGTITFLFKI
jgi:hypothetical protein